MKPPGYREQGRLISASPSSRMNYFQIQNGIWGGDSCKVVFGVLKVDSYHLHKDHGHNSHYCYRWNSLSGKRIFVTVGMGWTVMVLIGKLFTLDHAQNGA